MVSIRQDDRLILTVEDYGSIEDIKSNGTYYRSRTHGSWFVLMGLMDQVHVNSTVGQGTKVTMKNIKTCKAIN